MTVRLYDNLDMRREVSLARARRRRREGGFVGFGFGLAGRSGGVNYEAQVAAMALRFWWRAGNYNGSGAWSGQASAGASGSNTLSEATNYPDQVSSTINGINCPNYNGTDDRLSGASVITYYGTAAQYGWVLARLDAVDTNNANWALNDPLLMTSGTQQWGVIVRNTSGTYTVEHWVFTGTGDKTASTTFSVNTWTLFQWKNNGTTIGVRVNGGAWVTSSGGTVNSLAATLVVGWGGGGGAFCDGQFAEVGGTEVPMADADYDIVRAYCNQRYAVGV